MYIKIRFEMLSVNQFFSRTSQWPIFPLTRHFTEAPPAIVMTQQPSGSAKHLLAAVAVVVSVLFVALVISSDLRAVARSPNMWKLTPSRAPLNLDAAASDPPLSSGRDHHAILVPYRNRTYHLARFKEHMGPYLRRNFPNDSFTLWIVEQGDERLFNRAWLGNVGITEAIRAESRTQCIIFHDVDLVPECDGVPYNRCRLPTQLGSELEHFNWGVPYPTSFGGVTTMHVDHWRQVNGFSNDYWGWGGEDDDLFERVRINGLLDESTNTVHRPPKGKGRFHTISQSSQTHPKGVVGEKEYAYSVEILEEIRKNSDRWRTDGLSNVHYRILERSIDKSLPGLSAVVHIECTQ